MGHLKRAVGEWFDFDAKVVGKVTLLFEVESDSAQFGEESSSSGGRVGDSDGIINEDGEDAAGAKVQTGIVVGSNEADRFELVA